MEENRIQSIGEELVKLLEVKNAARERAEAKDLRVKARPDSHEVKKAA